MTEVKRSKLDFMKIWIDRVENIFELDTDVRINRHLINDGLL